MIITNFPGCCVAKVIHNFGGTNVTEGIKETISIDEIKKRLLDITFRYYGCILIATTNSEQKEANKALKEMGFKHSKWIPKQAHSETKVRLWWREP